MGRNYYISQSGRILRKDNTLYLEVGTETEGETKKIPIPIEDVEALYLYGELDLNTKLLNFLSQKKVVLHLFNYYGFYAGSYYPREYLNSGFLLVQQVEHYQSSAKRLFIAKCFVNGAIHGIQKNLSYYHNRGKDLGASLSNIEQESKLIKQASDIPTLMGVEGRVRKQYYEAFSSIIGDLFPFEKRTKRPPENPLNALISFGNSLCYTLCLGEIYHTQLNPLISYLHEPGERRFSLALDISEVFKPLLVDRVIFKVLNQKMIQLDHFD